MTPTTIGPLTNPDLAAVSALLSNAFAADPSYQYFLEGCAPAYRDRYRYLLVRFIVSYHCRSGMPVWGVTHQGVLVACALLEVPAPGWQRAIAVLTTLPSLMGRVPWSSVTRMNRYALHSRQGLPTSFRYFLVKIGVAPGQQGQGFGKMLISAIADHCRKLDQTLALDTENPANVPLYQHLGFHLHDERRLDTLRIYRLQLPPE